LGLADVVHRLPEPAVIDGAGGEADHARPGGGRPPLLERPFRAGGDDPVGARQRDVGADRRGGVGPSGTDDGVDHFGHAEILEHRPHCGQIPEAALLAALRFTWSGSGQTSGDLFA